MIGTQAPDATLIDSDGTPYQLSAAWSAGPAMLVFYPGDETPVCTAQLCSYRDRWIDFRSLHATLLAINPAAVARHQAFKDNHRFPFPVLSDPDSACCKAYGAKSWYGTRRVAVIIDRGGRIRWYDAVLPFFKPSIDRLLLELRASAAACAQGAGVE